MCVCFRNALLSSLADLLVRLARQVGLQCVAQLLASGVVRSALIAAMPSMPFSHVLNDVCVSAETRLADRGFLSTLLLVDQVLLLSLSTPSLHQTSPRYSTCGGRLVAEALHTVLGPSYIIVYSPVYPAVIVAELM